MQFPTLSHILVYNAIFHHLTRLCYHESYKLTTITWIVIIIVIVLIVVIYFISKSTSQPVPVDQNPVTSIGTTATTGSQASSTRNQNNTAQTNSGCGGHRTSVVGRPITVPLWYRNLPSFYLRRHSGGYEWNTVLVAYQ